MIYLFKELPHIDVDKTKWTPFLNGKLTDKNFMLLSRILQIALLIISIKLGIWSFYSALVNIFILILVFIVHEILHIAAIYGEGNISITTSGLDFWINTDRILSKKRFLLFMTVPIIILTIIPIIIIAFFNLDNSIRELLAYIAWINIIISRTDILNSILILFKPSTSYFYRGYYSKSKQI